MASTATTALSAQTVPAADTALARRVDSIAHQVLATTGVPSAAVAVVRDGRLAYAQAYGAARLDPRAPALPTMRYNVGSISKQFAASCILLLQQDGKLSLDDPVARFLPGLARAREVTIRQLLSHTSGYQDYWPQDYVPLLMQRPISADSIMTRWAKRPLDFDPGTRWQYSNTNYVIAGAIVEKAGGMPFFDFLRSRILEPLGMRSAVNSDVSPLSSPDPTGYMSYGLGPLHPAPAEGSGWMFAAGELAMTASDLATWDISVMDRSLLTPASYRELETEVLLANGVGTGYGLGVSVGLDAGHRLLSHGGEVSGFTASNRVYPDDRAAIVVLTNQDASTAAGAISAAIGRLLFGGQDATTRAKTAEARRIFEGLQHGTVDRSLFTEDANAYFDDVALRDFAASLGPLGAPQAFVHLLEEARGGMVERVYRVVFAGRTLRVWTYEMPDGKLEQYQVAAQN
jgi:CubicO group peptidase (beta-lactamase class C family)